jgi:hypothetical protein
MFNAPRLSTQGKRIKIDVINSPNYTIRVNLGDCAFYNTT